MKRTIQWLLILTLTSATGMLAAQSIKEYLLKANTFQQAGNLKKAIAVMEEAIQKHPNEALAYSYCGFFSGMQAGKTKDFMEAGNLVTIAFSHLEKAVSLNPNHPLPRFHRGVLGINVPEFLGKLNQGIKDLEVFVQLAKKNRTSVRKDTLFNAYLMLAQGYEKKKEWAKALNLLQQFLKTAPKGQWTKTAETQLERVKAKKVEQKGKQTDEASLASSGDSKTVLAKAKSFRDKKQYAAGRQLLKKLIEKEPKNLEAYRLLIEIVWKMAEKGYDEKIYNNTDYRTNLAFEGTRLVDKAVELDPLNIELRLMRGVAGVQMPFFVNKLEKAIKDLNWIVENTRASKNQKAEAFFWLGRAHQKKMMSYWIKVVAKYSKTPAVKSVFQQMRPAVKRLSSAELKKPCVVVDFLLGYEDELAPQTAVWVEDKAGRFVKTIYISGFSGFAKEKQINLPRWSESSRYRDVDGITSASINRGQHIFMWDLKDYAGNRVKPGKYLIRIEVAYWPSLQYQKVSAWIQILKKGSRVVIEEGDLVPYLEVNYFRG